MHDSHTLAAKSAHLGNGHRAKTSSSTAVCQHTKGPAMAVAHLLISMGDGWDDQPDSRFSQPWVLAAVLILFSHLPTQKQQSAAASMDWIVAQRPKTAIVGLRCRCMSFKSSAPCAGIMLYHKRIQLKTGSLASWNDHSIPRCVYIQCVHTVHTFLLYPRRLGLVSSS
jgi:hypothetical protein